LPDGSSLRTTEAARDRAGARLARRLVRENDPMPPAPATLPAAALGDQLSAREATLRVFLTAGGLAVLGIALLLFTIWWWRSTRPEPPALGPLEVMSERRWRAASEGERRRLVEVHRPNGALDGAPAPEPIDLSVLARGLPSGFDDLRDEPVVPDAHAAAEADGPVEPEVVDVPAVPVVETDAGAAGGDAADDDAAGGDAVEDEAVEAPLDADAPAGDAVDGDEAPESAAEAEEEAGAGLEREPEVVPAEVSDAEPAADGSPEPVGMHAPDQDATMLAVERPVEADPEEPPQGELPFDDEPSAELAIDPLLQRTAPQD
jgi:hypothetical protein